MNEGKTYFLPLRNVTMHKTEALLKKDLYPFASVEQGQLVKFHGAEQQFENGCVLSDNGISSEVSWELVEQRETALSLIKG